LPVSSSHMTHLRLRLLPPLWLSKSLSLHSLNYKTCHATGWSTVTGARTLHMFWSQRYQQPSEPQPCHFALEPVIPKQLEYTWTKSRLLTHWLLQQIKMHGLPPAAISSSNFGSCRLSTVVLRLTFYVVHLAILRAATLASRTQFSA
jgi:hypothetical protein